jgi:hypothetical protein
MNLYEIDRSISTFMHHWGTVALRISLGVIFIWFGILKPLGLSPAEPLVIATVKSEGQSESLLHSSPCRWSGR